MLQSNSIKKLFIYGLILCTTLFVSGCGKSSEDTKNEGQAEEVSADCQQLALLMALDFCDSDNMIIAVSGDGYFENYCSAYYGLSEKTGFITDGAVIYAYDGLATEIAVIRQSEEISVSEIADGIRNHLEDRKGVYTGYFPSEEEKIENAVLFSSGEYVVLAVSSISGKAGGEEDCVSRFEELLSLSKEELSELSAETDELLRLYEDNRAAENSGDTTSNSQENSEEDVERTAESTEENTEKITEETQLSDRDDSTYYNQDIVTAYQTGDASLLSDEKDIFILNEVKRIIGDIITEDMTELEKEKAVHDYLCINMDYDEAAVDIEENHLPDSDNPYGMLSEHYGICSGYASTFKLFMDCLEIPCMIVEGKANDFADDHAWNKVMIDGVWYNVDVTWDDPVYTGTDGQISRWYETYTFFNCTDSVLIDTDHQWNRLLYPKSEKE